MSFWFAKTLHKFSSNLDFNCNKFDVNDEKYQKTKKNSFNKPKSLETSQRSRLTLDSAHILIPISERKHAEIVSFQKHLVRKTQEVPEEHSSSRPE
jgi:hypothetical protein